MFLFYHHKRPWFLPCGLLHKTQSFSKYGRWVPVWAYVLVHLVRHNTTPCIKPLIIVLYTADGTNFLQFCRLWSLRWKCQKVYSVVMSHFLIDKWRFQEMSPPGKRNKAVPSASFMKELPHPWGFFPFNPIPWQKTPLVNFINFRSKISTR